MHSSNSETRIDTLKILEEIEATVEQSFNLMGFYRLNIDDFTMLINKLRASLPEDLRRAGHIAENSARILGAAHNEAEESMTAAKQEATQLVEAARQEGIRIVQEARGEANRLVDQHELIRRAEDRAAEIVQRAEASAEEMRAGADDYARESLFMLERHIKEMIGQLEGQSTTLLATVQKGRNQLERMTTGVPAANPKAPSQPETRELNSTAAVVQNGHEMRNGNHRRG